jgi:hypothetical protein
VATRYYQFLLLKYQGAIEVLRQDVHKFLSQENLDISKFVDRHKAVAKRAGLKRGLEQTRAYFALATLYGDKDGRYEPQRLDWFRAQFVTELPTDLPSKCMYIHVTDTNVEMILRGGNKMEQDGDQNLTDVSPLIAEMLRLWHPYAASAQPDTAEPYAIFKQEQQSYGAGYNDSGDDYQSNNAYQKLVARAWKVAGINSQEDADKEWLVSDRHGKGCDWARKVTGRARRGVVCKEGERHDDSAASAQGHAPTTERASYRAL